MKLKEDFTVILIKVKRNVSLNMPRKELKIKRFMKENYLILRNIVKLLEHWFIHK
jgi:hypothetical protein